MIKLHHLNNSRSQRILWFLEELEIDYEVIRYERDPETLAAPAALSMVHPLGKSPALEDDGNTLVESGAIVSYLAERYGHGHLAPPNDPALRQRYHFWLHFAEGSAMTSLTLKLYLGFLGHAAAPLLPRIDGQIAALLAYLESELGTNPYFLGAALTPVDILLSFPVEAAVARGGLDRNYPLLWSFLERIHARPAYRRALARGGPYQLAR